MIGHNDSFLRDELRSDILERFARLHNSLHCGEQDSADFDFCGAHVSDFSFTDEDFDPCVMDFSQMGGVMPAAFSAPGVSDGGGAEAAQAAAASASLPPLLLTGAIPSTKAEFRPVESDDKVPLQSGGYDGGLMVGFQGKPSDISAWNETVSVLESAQTLAKLAVEQGGYESPEGVSAVLGAEEVLVFPSGGKVDSLVYKYRFRARGIEFLIHSNPKGDIQPVRIRYGAESLMQNDFYVLHSEFVLPFLVSLGFGVTEEKVSRADFQVLVDVDMQTIFSYFVFSQVVTKFRKFTIHGCFTARGFLVFTITLGSKDKVQLCIYDKRRELRDHFSEVKEQLFIDNCVGQEWYYSDRPITRIEFRCGRTALKVFGVNSVLDLREKERRIIDSLAFDWFRVLAAKKVRGHESGAQISSFWERVRDEFLRYFPGPAAVSKPSSWRSGKRVSVANVEHLSRMALGCLTKIFACQRGKQHDKEGVRQIAGEWISDYKDVLYDKMNAYSERVRLMTGVSLGRDDDIEREMRDGLRSGWCAMLGGNNECK
jgi:hypothetical protein